MSEYLEFVEVSNFVQPDAEKKWEMIVHVVKCFLNYLIRGFFKDLSQWKLWSVKLLVGVHVSLTCV